ncbi:MAG TPA: hypothetical protein VG014_08040 [Acidimicrobiales bacterium]|nr:hypothetical protein [Acidimicrobiales bacterium]
MRIWALPRWGRGHEQSGSFEAFSEAFGVTACEFGIGGSVENRSDELIHAEALLSGDAPHSL